MEAVIGAHAGRIWAILKEKGTLTPTAIARELRLKTGEVDRALGWLAREGKLSFQIQRGALKISLSQQ